LGLELKAELAAQLSQQSEWCESLGSELYARLLAEASRDAAEGGVVWEAIGPHMPAPLWEVMLPLRFMAGVHAIVLSERAPALAAFYPSAGGAEKPAEAWVPFRDAIEEHLDEVRRLSGLPVQTNEVGRCAALIGGFLRVAASTRLPLRLLEVGSAAGLNLRWDHYRYEATDGAWGPEDSPVRLGWDDAPPNLDALVEVVERSGCDPHPMNPRDQGDQIRILSAVWPDQLDRIARLRGALVVAGTVPVALTRGTASEWLPQALQSPAPGVATVVFHSVVRQYLGETEQAELTRILESAGESASTDAPVAHLSFEPDVEQLPFAVRLRSWPGGAEVAVAISGPHGRDIRWL
jgi:hypothetical protein